MKNLFRKLFLVAAMVAGSAALAALEEGVDYFLVKTPAPLPEAGQQVVVTEYFNYSCPACNSWYPEVELWLETSPEYVEWQRVPLEFQRYSGLFARAHYVMEGFGRADLADEFFHAIHVERELLNSEGRIAEWLADEHGLDEDAAEKSFSSFAVNTKIKRAGRLADSFGVQSTPTFIVADRYLLSPGALGSPARLFEVMDELVTAVHEGNAPL